MPLWNRSTYSAENSGVSEKEFGALQERVTNLSNALERRENNFKNNVKNVIREYEQEQFKEKKIDKRFWIGIGIQFLIAVLTVLISYYVSHNGGK